MKSIFICFLSLASLAADAGNKNTGTSRVDEENLRAIDSVSEKRAVGERNKASVEKPVPQKKNPDNLRLGEDPFIDNMSGGQEKRE